MNEEITNLFGPEEWGDEDPMTSVFTTAEDRESGELRNMMGQAFAEDPRSWIRETEAAQ